MENLGFPGILKFKRISNTGLVGFKRILAYTKVTDMDPKRLKSILKHLQIKVENLEEAVEKAPKDLDHIQKMKNFVKWLGTYLYHLGGGL